MTRNGEIRSKAAGFLQAMFAGKPDELFILVWTLAKLARVSSVSRSKICTFELGDSSLTAKERVRLTHALVAEAQRQGHIAASIDCTLLDSSDKAGIAFSSPPRSVQDHHASNSANSPREDGSPDEME